MNERVKALDGAKVKAAHRVQVVSADADLDALMGKRFHLIGIGGVGMSALARVLLKHGAYVTGSDQSESPVVAGLRIEGAEIAIGHHAEHVPSNTESLVMSAAVKPENPELQVAQAQGMRIYKYAEMLGQLMNRYHGIAVAGTHGKSTTSGWLSYVLRQAGVDVSFVVGAETPQLQASSGVGESHYFVAEACEYDRSFHNIRPVIACILNIEADHLDYYQDEAEIVDAFTQFALGTVHAGTVVINGQDTNASRVIEQLRPDLRCVRFGLGEDCDVRAEDLTLVEGCYQFQVVIRGRNVGQTCVRLPGLHNVLNALAVVAVADQLDLPEAVILPGLASFTGVQRRLMLKDRCMGITVLDDYAHHPTEIRCSLEAIRQRYPGHRLYCVFQPHQHSRTRFLLDDFAESFKLADMTIVPEIYFVRDSEQCRQWVDGEIFVERLRGNGCEAAHIKDFEAICTALEAQVHSGDVVVTMGAGDVWKVADEFIQRLRRHC
ncbi:UDP-N-acetylmuramate--L-alanine ligase [Planctomycetota bacterium]